MPSSTHSQQLRRSTLPSYTTQATAPQERLAALYTQPTAPQERLALLHTANSSNKAPCRPTHTGNSSAGALCRPPRNPTNSALDLDLHALDLDLPSARHSASCPPMQQFCGRSRRLRAATGTWSGCRQADRLKTPVLGLRTLQPYAPAAF